MTKAEIEKLAERYQKKADEAYANYQETGITRYDTTRRNNEDLADALRMAAAASDDHAALVHLRGTFASLAAKAESIQWAAESQKEERTKSLVNELLSAARMMGLIRTEKK